MSKILQQMSLDEKQESVKSRCFQGGSRASLTALQESVNRLLMSVIYGQSTGESLAKLDQHGYWQRMYGDCLQANLDGSFEEFSGICPAWGLMLDGVLIQPHGLEPFIDESEFLLLPTPIASDRTAWIKTNKTNVSKSLRKCLTIPKKGRGLMQSRLTYYSQVNGHSILTAAAISETIMGFPKGYTDLSV